jgi:hypothetical protein
VGDNNYAFTVIKLLPLVLLHTPICLNHCIVATTFTPVFYPIGFRKNNRSFQLSGMKQVQPGNIVYIKDEFYIDNNLSVMEIPRYAWRVNKIENTIASCEFQRRGRNSIMTLTIEIKYLKIENL